MLCFKIGKTNLSLLFAVPQEPQQVVSSFPGVFSHSALAEKAVDKCDVVVCGGTLGIFIATALSAKGLKVSVVERNILKGVHFTILSSFDHESMTNLLQNPYL